MAATVPLKSEQNLTQQGEPEARPLALNWPEAELIVPALLPAKFF
jgi:hypothetical protein